jgi:hypothetical protein
LDSEKCAIPIPEPTLSGGHGDHRPDHSIRQNRDVGAHAFGLVKVVRRDHHSGPFVGGQSPDQGLHALGGHRVEASRRFVQQKYLGLPEQRPSQAKPLPHPRAVPDEQFLAHRPEVDELERLGSSPTGVPWAKASQSAKKLEILPPSEAPVESPFLAGRKTDRSPDRGGSPDEIGSVDTRGPARRQNQGGQDFQESGLAGPVGTDDSEHFSALDFERDTPKGMDLMAQLPADE